MKMMKWFLLLVLLVASVGVATADHLQTRFRADLSGSQEVPPVNTDAHGEAVFHLTEDGDELLYVLQARNIENVAAAHIHTGAVGVNGGVIVTLCGGPGVAPPCGGPDGRLHVTGSLTETLSGDDLSVLLDAMRSGDTYVNVHTAVNPGGEIRGQIK